MEGPGPTARDAAPTWPRAHTSIVHRLVLVGTLLTAFAARADEPAVPRPPPPDPDRGNFWRELISPHKDEVDLIVIKAKQAINTADIALYSDYDPTGLERARMYREIYGMLRYARKLAPDNLDVLRLIGQTADEIGKTREAVEAFQAAVDLAGIDKAGVDVNGRLGAIYLRLGKLDDALRHLRAAQGAITPGQPITAQVLVHLSNALAMRGQMTEAIDVLANALPTTIQYYTNELTLVSFALAVQYDRDEDPGAAFEVLDKMQNVLSGQLAAMGQNVLAAMRFAPAEDRHYYYGLLWEAAGHYIEARAEWALYAAAGKLPYHQRALDHIAAIDALRRAPASELNRYQIRIHHRVHP